MAKMTSSSGDDVSVAIQREWPVNRTHIRLLEVAFGVQPTGNRQVQD